MKAYREEMPVRPQPRSAVPVLIGALVLIAAVLAYFALRDSSAPVAVTPTPAPAPLATASDVEPVAVAPPEAAAVAERPAAANPPAAANNFVARELAPPRVAVSVGEAPVVERENNDDFFVIDGELLETLEAEAPPRPVIE